MRLNHDKVSLYDTLGVRPDWKEYKTSDLDNNSFKEKLFGVILKEFTLFFPYFCFSALQMTASAAISAL